MVDVVAWLVALVRGRWWCGWWRFVMDGGRVAARRFVLYSLRARLLPACVRQTATKDFILSRRYPISLALEQQRCLRLMRDARKAVIHAANFSFPAAVLRDAAIGRCSLSLLSLFACRCSCCCRFALRARGTAPPLVERYLPCSLFDPLILNSLFLSYSPCLPVGHS